MDSLGPPKINLSRFFNEAPSHEINGKQMDAKSLMDSVSMISLKLNSENVHQAKSITTEGLSLEQRFTFIENLKKSLGRDVFELSTCNRVLYVGFSVESQELEKHVNQQTGLSNVPFVHTKGLDVWRKLVKICSGLDSFMMGELQIMGQFRDAVAWHREHDFVDMANGSFFDHVISANRVLRKEFGFTQTTESMLNLATNALEEIISQNSNLNCTVLGFGEMGGKAVETLLGLEQTNISVVSRSPKQSAQRHPLLSKQVEMKSFDSWNKTASSTDLVISTIRNKSATYTENRPLPVSSNSIVMDFAWPPSIEATGLQSDHVLYGMEHWIRVSRKLGIEWDYDATLQKSETLLNEIESRFMEALTQRTQAKFRAFIYSTMEDLAKQWSTSEHVDGDLPQQLSAFSREIATWLCNQDGPFNSDEIDKLVLQTNRPFGHKILERVSADVRETVLHINGKSSLSEVIG
ncbi:MAG: hypothetical protein CMA10_06125 [Euryarchaeota archaeon]|nr:hypothetical protein [Euryarchaeota archaeon]|tara:strand:+ start:2154 stop:3545 length:1392 start_codon:yes stop_codon:yes gene_type:complete